MVSDRRGEGGLTIHKFLIINVLYLLREVFCIILMVPDVRTDSRETAVVAVAGEDDSLLCSLILFP